MGALAAAVNYPIAGGWSPIEIIHWIASALLGRDAADSGGWLTAAFGLLLHFLVAQAFTVSFFLLDARMRALSKKCRRD